MFKRARSFGLFSVLTLAVVTLLSLVLLNTIRFDGSIRAIFDREQGLYDQSMPTRSQSYWLEALTLISQFDSTVDSDEARQKILERIDLAYAYLNVGRYLDSYSCTEDALNAMLQLRNEVERQQLEATRYKLWHDVFSCYAEVQADQEELKAHTITHALDVSHRNQFWMNFGISVTFALGVILWLMTEYHDRRHNREIKERLAWQTRALRDHLTSTYNRLALQQRLEELAEQWSKKKIKSAAVIFYDLDYFKAYNDTFGHVAGDEALRRVAEAVNQLLTLRENHFRFGGEEFFIILDSGQSKDEVIEIGEQIIKAVRQLKISNPASETGYLTVSLGIYCLEEDAYTSDELIQKADELLYSAKNSGRNCAIDCHS